MKSAYEIAMERMRQESGETRSLNAKQKARIAEIEAACLAKVAGARLALEPQIAAAPPETRPERERQLADDIRRFQEAAERDKQAVWDEAK